jgi:hypothetical protein
MMRRLSILAVLAAALAVPAAAGGAAAPITLRLNDGFVPQGTSIVCAVELSRTLVPGAKLLSCFISTRTGAVPKTYTVALAVNGEVALGRVGTKGKVTVVMKRGGTGPVVKQKDNGNVGRVYRARIGSTFIVKGTAISCAVAKQSFAGKSATVVACFKLGANGKPRPNTYGIGITDGGAFLVHFDAKSKATPIKIVEHGH